MEEEEEEEERRTAHSAPDVVSLSDFARCQEDLRGMPTSTVVLHAHQFLERKGGKSERERLELNLKGGGVEGMRVKWGGRFNFRHSGGKADREKDGERERPSEQGRGLRGQQTSRRRVRTARFHLFASPRQVYGQSSNQQRF